jgi:hypothetical protein
MKGTEEYKVGRGKPPLHTRFKKGDIPNPGGKTSEQKKMELENAARATRIRARMLEALEGVMNEHPEKEKIVSDLIKAEMLKLIKDSEDRGLGTPKASVDVSSPDGTMSPRDNSAAILAALERKHKDDDA